MSVPRVTALLTCKGGDLAGAKFELGTETLIGRDAAGRLVVMSGGRELHTRELRIFLRDGVYFVENVGAAGQVRVDGAIVNGTVALARMHVIDIAESASFMYSQRLAPAKPAESVGTVVDADAFEAIPSLRAKPAGEAGTVVDANAFGALPSLHPRSPAVQAAENSGATRIYEPVPTVPPLELSINLPGVGPTTLPLKYGDNVMGRGAGCDVRVLDPEKWLSRKHAILKVAADRVELVDLNGSNGTFVKGVRISSAVLPPGSHFTLGPHFEFTLQKR